METEYSLNVGRIESLMPEQKELFRILIETTVSLVQSIKSRSELPNLSKGWAGLFKKPLQGMMQAGVLRQIVELWRGTGQPTPAEQFEKIVVDSPSKKLSGFRLRGGDYPIFPPDELIKEKRPLLVLGERKLHQIYIALGGNREEAEQLFPTTRQGKGPEK